MNKQGFTKFKLTKRQHNKLFPKRKTRWTHRCEYYYSEHGVKILWFISWRGLFVLTLTLPFSVMMHGLINIKDIWKEYTDCYKVEDTSDYIERSEKYDEIMETIGKQ